MAEKIITYTFLLSDEKQESFELTFDEETFRLQTELPDNLPEWTKLDFHKCSHCPLSSDTHPNCPLVSNIADIVSRFDELLSYEEVRLTVQVDDKLMIQSTSLQNAIGSLMGLIIASSDCPHTFFFRPMARFHRPLAQVKETTFRALSTFLIFQYILNKDGKDAGFDLSGLAEVYKNMHIVNTAVAERIQVGSKSDSSLNALIVLDLFTGYVPDFIDEEIEVFRPFFEPYLKDIGSE